MKRKIRVIGPDGKVLEGEVKIRDLAHLEACLKYRSTVVEDKRFRKPKHKKKEFEENY